MNKPLTTTPEAADLEYQSHILQLVSRTFALTIPQLPEAMCRVVGNAYLLCRIADTIEDDSGLEEVDKRKFAEQFIQVVAGTAEPETFAQTLAPLLTHSTSDAEHDLIRHTPSVIRVSHSFNLNQRKALERCIRIMAKGMADYQELETLDGLENLSAMDRYCYYVAGVVGEMLTELYCDYDEAINRQREQLMPLAVSFGQGLQMTNILKDIWDDRARGACWLPQDVFSRQGFDLSGLHPGNDDPGFGAGMGILIGVARQHLQDALRYTLMIPARQRGIRLFCLWALGMAILTLRKIDAHRDFSEGSQVKISRRSVKATVALTRACVSSDKLLRLLFYITSRRLPETRIRETLGQLSTGTETHS